MNSAIANAFTARSTRIAKSAGRLDELERLIIPAVPAELRHTSSWPPHFRGQGPAIKVARDGRLFPLNARSAVDDGDQSTGSNPALTS
nr:hypothetical protein [Chenggangzhangella methanolivorans]